MLLFTVMYWILNKYIILHVKDTLPVKLFMFTDDRSGTIKKDFEWHPLVAGVYHEVSDCVSLFGSKQ